MSANVRFRPYFLSLAAVIATVAARFALDPLVHSKAPYLLFVAGVAVAALFGGLASGITATILSMPICDYFFIEPRHTWFIFDARADSIALAVFTAVGIGESALIDHFRRVRERLRQTALELERSEGRFRTRSEELAASNAEFQKFAYRVSHDLNEPLRTIHVFTELLAKRNETRMDQESNTLVGYILGSADRIQHQIRQLLEYAKAGSLEMKEDLIDFGAIFETAVSNLRSAIFDTGATITHDPLPSLRANPDAVRSILQNLIGNALKYRSERPPRIHLSARLEVDEWIFAVADNGIGFEMADAQRIFGTFERLSPAGAIQGSGLGLAIVKRIVEIKRGRVWAESEPGKGSTFFFTLPNSAEDMCSTPNSDQQSLRTAAFRATVAHPFSAASNRQSSDRIPRE